MASGRRAIASDARCGGLGLPPNCGLAAGIGDSLGACAAQPPTLARNWYRTRRVRSSGPVDSLNIGTKPAVGKTFGFEACRGSELGLHHSLGDSAEHTRRPQLRTKTLLLGDPPCMATRTRQGVELGISAQAQFDIVLGADATLGV